MTSTASSNLPQIPGYSILEQLYNGSKTAVYRAVEAHQQHPVIIKVLQHEYPNFSELVQFRNQYTIAKNLAIAGIVHPLSLEPWRNSFALVMEDVGGLSLKQYAQNKPLNWLEVLGISLQLADILHDLIQHRVVHKDIKPANLLICPQSKQIKLIDFSIASLLPKETQELKNPNVLEGTLAYLAPEQTGRMNRGIDYRTDFYSLGVTLFELLTGELPFQSNDPMELVHHHIAKVTTFPKTQHPIPHTLKEIVLKLMAKNAEDRYQSALGLKYDLEQCLSQKKEISTVTAFKLAQRDFSDRFLIPEKLYGRETEVQTLIDAFERVAQGKTEMMLVAGFSGIGKTAIVNEVHKPIVRRKGYFIKGKFDQFNRNIPFSAFVQALRDLMRQLLSESDAQLQQWKSQILDVLGENGQVIIEVVPELEKIISQQPPVAELSGSAAQNRFNLLFGKFIQVFTAKEHPLVIFLDDLQWADSASLNLIKLLMIEASSSYLLMIGAYRDNEVFPAHPLMLTLDDMRKENVTINTITLAALSENNINRLVADTLSCNHDVAKLLTELVYQKTKGNPFFTTQFLLGLYDEGLIKLERALGHWEFDIAQVRQQTLSDDVVEFMAGRLQKLPVETQQVLKLAACIGNQFDLQTLAIVSQQSQTETSNALWKALQEGLILPQSEIYKFYIDQEQQFNQVEIADIINYKFLHDRVQQAAYSLIHDQQKQTTHYQIGQLLLEKITPEAREDKIFEIVNQLNYGTDLITEQNEKDKLAQLNLIACRKARSATAYQAGREYTTIGLFLLGQNAWQRQYEMSLAFSEFAAEFAALCGDFETMENFVERVIEQAKSLLDQLNVYLIKIQSNSSLNKLTQAVAIGQQLLKQFGVTFPDPCTPTDIQRKFAEIRELIGKREIEDLADLPRMTDRKKIAILQIANSIMPASYLSASPLYPILVTLSVKLSIQHGNTSASAISYSTYGLLACNLLQDVSSGVKFGQLAVRIVSTLDAKTVKPDVFNVMGLFILHRTSHLKETLSVMQEGYEAALEIGNLEYVGYTAGIFCFNSFWCSQSLTHLEQETRVYYDILVQFNQLTTANWCRIVWQSTLCLLGVTEQDTVFSQKALLEKEFLPQLLCSHDLLGLYFFYLHKLTLCYLLEELELGQNYAVEVKQYLSSGAGTFGEPVFYFYDSLIALASLKIRTENIPEILQKVDQNQIKLQQHWADYAPMNHQHKYDLVAAEKCRVLGQKLEAIELYDKAISGAKENKYIQEEALANELAAKFYLNWDKEKVAAGYMQEAYYCYAKWGAKAKTDDLEQRYPDLLQPILQHPTQTLDPFQTLSTLTQSHLSLHHSSNSYYSSSSINNTLDFAAVLKAYQALSEMIELNKLLRQLTQIILQNSGGDRCGLILPDSHGEWTVKAIATLEETELCSQPLENNPNLPIKLIQYVKNTQEVVVIDDLNTDLPVIDEYLLAKKPKSLLCLPILNQGHLIGILYLKNLYSSGAFTTERILVLNFLCTQAAISLENARLYQQAQDYAQQLEQSQLQIVQNEKMASLGNLVAGIAHEINNPLGFLNGSIVNIQDYFQEMIEHFQLYQQYYPDVAEPIQENAEEIDLDFLCEDIPHLLDSMQLATQRIENISTSLRSFSRADTEHKVSADLHEGLDSTLMILKYRLKASENRPEIEVVKHYGTLPTIMCFPGQMNQVFMNIIANGIDVFDEVAEDVSDSDLEAKPQTITIQTALLTSQNLVEITISDNGKGMPPEVKERIFDHLFTTKAVGKGTGLGLAIARQIIVDKHSGSLDVNSAVGQGTQFRIQLPIISSVES